MKVVADIECISKSACSSCNNQNSCGVGTVAKSFTDKSHTFEVPYKEGMVVDQYIELQMANGDLITIASLIYLLPLFFFIASALTLHLFFVMPEIYLIITSAVVGIFGFILAKVISHKLFVNRPSKSLVTTKMSK